MEGRKGRQGVGGRKSRGDGILTVVPRDHRHLLLHARPLDVLALRSVVDHAHQFAAGKGAGVASHAPEFLKFHRVLALPDLVHGEGLELAGLTDLGLRNEQTVDSSAAGDERGEGGRTNHEPDEPLGRVVLIP